MRTPSQGLAALLFLTRLRFKAKLRSWGRGLRQPKRLLLLLLGVILVGLFVASQFAAGEDGRPFDGEYSAIGLAGFLTFFLAATSYGTLRNGSMAFTPAEVQFLFPGPVGTRALIASHLLSAGAKSLTGALVFALFLHVGDGPRWRSALGFALVFEVLVVLGLALDLTHMHLDPARRRRHALLFIAFVVAWIAGTIGSAYVIDGQALSVELVRWTVLPGKLFAGVILGDEATALWQAAACIALIAGMTLFCLRWKRPVRGPALIASDRVQQVLKRVSKGQGMGGKIADASDGRVLPRLPFWGGAGPHVWRQLSAMRRRSKSFGVLIAFSAVTGVVLTFTGNEPRPEAGAMVAIVTLAWSGPFYVHCDFRADYDALPWLRSLPTSATALAAGQLLASTIVLTALQLVIGGWGILFTEPQRLAGWIVGLAALPLFNMVMFAVENGVYLISPVRFDATKGAPGGGQILRLYGVLLAKLVVVAVVMGLAVVPALGVGWITGMTWLGMLVGWTALAFEAAMLVVFVGRIYRWVDPSRDLVSE